MIEVPVLDVTEEVFDCCTGSRITDAGKMTRSTKSQKRKEHGFSFVDRDCISDETAASKTDTAGKRGEGLLRGSKRTVTTSQVTSIGS